MNSTETRVLKLEAQMNALAQAWLYLAASLEMECGVDLAPMEQALSRKHWPSAPELDEAARGTLKWLCGELSAARAVRAARLRDRRGIGW
ncbi:hypothetical protein [Thauera butanivorans]|uniref:hypothetical protein n=1 Tax=Thauera butanivorans TaxID=86174 RepID=UPI00083964D9|nr:hypothetical protein [Thauera butanivorans]